MPSTYTPIFGLEKQATGEHADTWGDNLNGTLTLIENAIAKKQAIATTGGTTVLTTTQGADNQSRCLCLDLSGTLVSNAIIEVPNVSKLYLVRNNTTGSFTVTIATSADILATTGVEVEQGALVFVYCDGTNVFAPTLANINSLGLFVLAESNYILAGNRERPQDLVDGATVTLDVAAANINRLSIAGDRTLVTAGELEGSWFDFYITQTTGGNTIDWPANFLWAGGAAPTLSAAANVTDRVFGRYNAVAGVWYVSFQNSFAVAPGGSTSITVTGNQTDLDLFAASGSPVMATTINLTIAAGVVVSSTSSGNPAIRTAGFASGSILNIVVLGYVLGCGGHGGRGGWAGTGDDSGGFDLVPLVGAATAGRPGGTAIQGPGAGITCTVNTDVGFVWGGGGGGGGGGPSDECDVTGAGTGTGSAGGGGGGGQGGGIGGDGGSFAAAAGLYGSTGGRMPSITGSVTAGVGIKTSGASGTTISGGVGGDWGTAGTAGVSDVSKTFRAPGGAAGAAGKAVDANGGSVTVTTIGSPHTKGATS